MPVAMYPKLPFKATQHDCGDCGQAIWVSHGAPTYSRLVCMDCFEEQARPGDMILQQTRDIAATIKKERMP